MNRRLIYKHIVIILYSCVLLACAGTTEEGDDAESDARSSRSDCIFTATIRGYTVLDESNLLLDAGGRRKYHVTLRRRAYGLNSAWNIRFDTVTGRVCGKFDSLVYQSHHGISGEMSVRIAMVRKLTPEDYDDLLIKFGKKDPEIIQAPAPHDVKGADVEELDPAATDDSSGN